MQISFADSRPAGDYALVLPVAGSERPRLAVARLGEAPLEAALKRQRFDGEPGAVAEDWLAEGDAARRLLIVGTGKGPATGESAEKLGGTTVGASCWCRARSTP